MRAADSSAEEPWINWFRNCHKFFVYAQMEVMREEVQKEGSMDRFSLARKAVIAFSHSLLTLPKQNWNQPKSWNCS
jgi:hypothetical protein